MNVEEEIIQKEIQYNEELNKEVSIHDDDEIMKQELENNIYKNKNRINDKVEQLYKEVIDLYENSD